MNCKPGDLAVIVRCPPVPDAVGKIVECLTYHPEHLIQGVTYRGVWSVQWAGHKCPGEGWGCVDAWMRPIRDPGDDAVDEMLQLSGSPAWFTA